MKRGDVVTAVLSGNYGKPRPVLVVQSDLYQGHASLTVVPLTSTLLDAPLFRLPLYPSASNGLREVSQIMIDKVATIRRERSGGVIGEIDGDVMLAVSRALAMWLGIAS